MIHPYSPLRSVPPADLTSAPFLQERGITPPLGSRGSAMSVGYDSDEEQGHGRGPREEQGYCWVGPDASLRGLAPARTPSLRSRSASPADAATSPLPSCFDGDETSREVSPAADERTFESLAASTSTVLAGPQVVASGRPPLLDPSVEALRVAATAQSRPGHGRDLLFLGMGIALATGAALAHERWLTPALAFATPYAQRAVQTCQHLADGVAGFAYAYRHGVPQAIYGSDGQLLPCQTVVHTQLVAPGHGGGHVLA